MSTRRARIKAVTSLPPRRKNADNADNKRKQVPNKEDNDSQNCPRTPRSLAKIDENSLKSPAGIVPSPIIKSPEPIPETIKSVTPDDKSNTGKNLERVPVITTAPSSRPLFISPQAKGSPRRKPVPSPVRTPKTVENYPKPVLEKDVPAVIKSTDTVTNEKTPALDISKEISNKNVPENKTDIPPDDYNIPSVPESVTEDGMDGIIPLQLACSAPKPIDLLKNEIISEKAEVLFDPIVPLPSPSKLRPKLRPVPRLAPLRRNSVQGSASESEDETRRALLSSGSTGPLANRQRHDSQTSQSTIHSMPNREGNRIRNDSVCSNISQVAGAPPTSTSPVKEKHFPKSRRQEISRRMAAMRKRRETIKRDNLTMYDLIFYNPDSNPIIPDQDELDAKEANEKEAANKTLEKENEATKDENATDAAPVPQIKLGPNGEIVLDEQSLVINQSASNRKVSAVVREGSWGGSGNSYRRTARTADWSDAETVRFYRALAAIGTDFTLMQPLFPGRTRRDLKLKFKKEEKCNGGQVDKALRSSVEWDAVRLQGEFSAEREAAARRTRLARDTLQQEKREHQQRKLAAKDLKLKQSRSTAALGSSVMPDNLDVSHNENEITTADEIIRRANAEKLLQRKRKETHPVTQPTQPTQITPQQLMKTPQQGVSSPFATLTLIQNNTAPQPTKNSATDVVTLSKLVPKPTNLTNMPQTVNPISAVPGSLVVLTVNDPNSPSKKMLQTYIAHAEGVLTPVALPPTLLNSVVGYMKIGTPKSTVSARSSPSLTSPVSVVSHDSRTCLTPSVIQVNPSPTKRQRHSSYTITPL